MLFRAPAHEEQASDAIDCVANLVFQGREVLWTPFDPINRISPFSCGVRPAR